MAKLRSHLLPNKSPFSILKLLTILLSLPTTLHALLFDLPSGHTKCISDDLHANTVALAHYRIAIDEPHTHKISASISDPLGDCIGYAESVASGKFAFAAKLEGQHTVCFWSSKFELSTTILVDFEWKTGVAAKDWKGTANKGKIETLAIKISLSARRTLQKRKLLKRTPRTTSLPLDFFVMELELKKLEESVQSIHEEMMFLRQREEEMQKIDKITNSRMASLSLLSLFICLGVAGLQLWHLKVFFERKKIL